MPKLKLFSGCIGHVLACHRFCAFTPLTLLVDFVSWDWYRSSKGCIGSSISAGCSLCSGFTSQTWYHSYSMYQIARAIVPIPITSLPQNVNLNRARELLFHGIYDSALLRCLPWTCFHCTICCLEICRLRTEENYVAGSLEVTKWGPRAQLHLGTDVESSSTGNALVWWKLVVIGQWDRYEFSLFRDLNHSEKKLSPGFPTV